MACQFQVSCHGQPEEGADPTGKNAPARAALLVMDGHLAIPLPYAPAVLLTQVGGATTQPDQINGITHKASGQNNHRYAQLSPAIDVTQWTRPTGLPLSLWTHDRESKPINICV